MSDYWATAERQRLVMSAHDFHGAYSLGKPLGRGTYGAVYLAQIAVKLHRPDTADSAANEAEILGVLGAHPNVVQLLGVQHLDNGCVALMLNYARGGALAHALSADPEWGRRNVRRIVRDTASALAFCHARNVVHCDVTPGNLLLAGPPHDQRVVLADFGLAAHGPTFSLSDEITALQYRAPESLLYTAYHGVVPRGTPALEGTDAVDVWSAGCVAALAAGVPFVVLDHGAAEDNRAQLVAQLAYARPNEAVAWAAAVPYLVAFVASGLQCAAALVPDPRHRAATAAGLRGVERVGAAGAALIERMLALDPGRRPSANDVLADAWVVG